MTETRWIREPTPTQVADAVRAHVKAVGFVGRVVLRCTMGADGALTRCTVIEESHPGYGLREAALALAPLFRTDVRTVKPGSQVEASVRLPAPAP